MIKLRCQCWVNQSHRLVSLLETSFIRNYLFFYPENVSMSTECPTKWEDGKWATQAVVWHTILSGDDTILSGDVSSKSKCVAACLKKKGTNQGDFTNVNYRQHDKYPECHCIIAKGVKAIYELRSKQTKNYDTCVLKTRKGLYSWGYEPKFSFLSSI